MSTTITSARFRKGGTHFVGQPERRHACPPSRTRRPLPQLMTTQALRRALQLSASQNISLEWEFVTSQLKILLYNLVLNMYSIDLMSIFCAIQDDRLHHLWIDTPSRARPSDVRVAVPARPLPQQKSLLRSDKTEKKCRPCDILRYGLSPFQLAFYLIVTNLIS